MALPSAASPKLRKWIVVGGMGIVDIGCHHHHHHHQYHHHHHHLQLPIMDGAPTLALTLAAIAFALA